jgi:predicted metal-dependent enzyme (double-stranded beta helix superfamily)
VQELVARFSSVPESADPLNTARGILDELSGDLESLDRALQYISGVGGNANQIFYRSPEISLLKVCFPNGRRTPPHDHGTWAAILVLSGQEKNTLYRREKGALRKAGEKTLSPGTILTMRPETPHVVECLGDAPTTGLHVYGGDILGLPRRLWNPQTMEEHPLDWELYETFARTASAAACAPAP